MSLVARECIMVLKVSCKAPGAAATETVLVGTIVGIRRFGIAKTGHVMRPVSNSIAHILNRLRTRTRGPLTRMVSGWRRESTSSWGPLIRLQGGQGGFIMTLTRSSALHEGNIVAIDT